MKTTLDLPDHLLIAAKQRAAELRQPLRELVAEGLRQLLQQEPRPRSGLRPINWVTVPGELKCDVSSRDSLYNWLSRQDPR